MTPAEMREMAAKKAEIFTLGMPLEGSRRLIAAIRAIPIPDTTAADDALEKAREALERLSTAEVFTSEGMGWTHPEFAARIYFAREALAAIDAAKAKGGG